MQGLRLRRPRHSRWNQGRSKRRLLRISNNCVTSPSFHGHIRSAIEKKRAQSVNFPGEDGALTTLARLYWVSCAKADQFWGHSRETFSGGVFLGANRLFRSMLALFALLLVASIVFNRSLGQKPAEPMPISTLQAKLEKGEVKSVVITENTADVTLNSGDTKYTVNLPAGWTQTSELNAALYKKDAKGNPLAEVKSEKSPFSSPLFSVLGLLLPLILFGAFWIFIMRQSQSGAGQAMSFGKEQSQAFDRFVAKSHLCRRRGRGRSQTGIAGSH